MSDQTAIDREQERRIIDVLSSRSDTLSRDAHRALMAAARERDRLEDQIGVQAAIVAELNRGLLALRDEQARLRDALEAILDDAVGASHEPLWIVRREFIDAARAALAGAPEGTQEVATSESQREALSKLSELVQEVRRAHRDKTSADYNECETAECAWCEDTQRALVALGRAPEGTAAEPAAQEQNSDKAVHFGEAGAAECGYSSWAALRTSKTWGKVTCNRCLKVLAWIQKDQAPAPPAAPLHAALRTLVEQWRAMAKSGQENIVPGDDCAIARWTTAEMLADDLEALLSAPAVPSSPPPEAHTKEPCKVHVDALPQRPGEQFQRCKVCGIEVGPSGAGGGSWVAIDRATYGKATTWKNGVRQNPTSEAGTKDRTVLYRCDHCGHESAINASTHCAHGCDRTNCDGRRSPVPWPTPEAQS